MTVWVSVLSLFYGCYVGDLNSEAVHEQSKIIIIVVGLTGELVELIHLITPGQLLVEIEF